MNRYVNTEISQQIMVLEQLGANIKVVDGKMVYVKFTLHNGLVVSYVYHVNKNDKYFLERIKPYPLPLREYDTDEDVVNIIAIDYIQYQNATNSHNIKHFVDINKQMHHTVKAFEDLFLYYNVPEELLNDIDESMQRIQKRIDKASCECNRVFFEKDPDNLSTL